MQPEADFDAVVAHEFRISKSLDGRSVFKDAGENAYSTRKVAAESAQMRLF
jgi:hypothetical protein